MLLSSYWHSKLLMCLLVPSGHGLHGLAYPDGLISGEHYTCSSQLGCCIQQSLLNLNIPCSLLQGAALLIKSKSTNESNCIWR